MFFVLSGFVISFVVDTKEKSWREYALSRYVRLGSVFLPALLLALVLAPVDRKVGWQGWDSQIHALSVSGINALYLGQNWFLNIRPPNNPPAWSLNYEAWYYFIFGLAVFCRGRWRWIAAALAAALAGPKILLLMPPWLAGSALYHQQKKLRLNSKFANWLFLCSLGTYGVYFVTHLNNRILEIFETAVPGWTSYLLTSNRFLGDYLLTLIVVANFIGARDMENWLSRRILHYQPFIRKSARYTLSIYLYHWPLMVILGGWIGGDHISRMQGILVCVLLIPAVMVLAWMTEFQHGAINTKSL